MKNMKTEVSTQIIVQLSPFEAYHTHSRKQENKFRGVAVSVGFINLKHVFLHVLFSLSGNIHTGKNTFGNK